MNSILVKKFKKKFLSRDCFYWLSYYVVEYLGLAKYLSDKHYIQLRYRCAFSKSINLKTPVTFNEKINWLKLYDHNPLYTSLVDKAEVKEWVSNRIGKQYIIPTLREWNRIEDIEWGSLPAQFVIKWNHDSGSVVICRSKSSFDIEKAKQVLYDGEKNNGYTHAREWPYKNVKKKLILEPYIEDKETQELRDYKFFCFNGVVRALFVATDRQNRVEPFFNFFDINYKPLGIKQGHPVSQTIPLKPKGFEKMKEIASKLSEGFPHVRVDLYEANGEILFGELTFYHFGGLVPFNPDSIDYEWGEYIDLSLVSKNS